MSEWNQTLFRWLTTGHGTNFQVDQAAAILAGGLPWFAGLLLAMFWLRQPPERRCYFLLALAAGLLGTALGYLALAVLPSPPVVSSMVAGTHVLISRRLPSSLPAPGIVFILAAALSLWFHAPVRRWGWMMLGLALAAGVLRIYERLQLPFYLLSCGVPALAAAWLTELVRTWAEHWHGVAVRRREF